jgi:hypothetical protein
VGWWTDVNGEDCFSMRGGVLYMVLVLVVFSISKLWWWLLVIVYNYGLHLHRCGGGGGGGGGGLDVVVVLYTDRYFWTCWWLSRNPLVLLLWVGNRSYGTAVDLRNKWTKKKNRIYVFECINTMPYSTY